jgi:hypothetical protein
MQSPSHNGSIESESGSSDSQSHHSDASSISVTTEEDNMVTWNYDAKTEILERVHQTHEDTATTNIHSIQDRTKQNTDERERFDSGIGDSITSYSSSTSDSRTRARLLSVPSGSFEEEVFSLCDNGDTSYNDILRKRKYSDRYQTCTLKRQRNIDEDDLCRGPNNAF